jgi:hypothetical protein
MPYDVKEAPCWPVNELGEIVMQTGKGSINTVGYISSSQVAIDPDTKKVVFAGVAQLAQDANNNTIGIVGADGNLISKILSAIPSGDLTGVTDRTNIELAISTAASKHGQVFIQKGAYTVDRAVLHLSNVHVEFAPGTVIKLRDKTATLATWGAGAATITVADPTGILMGMNVSDTAVNLQSTGNAFGAFQYGTLVNSIVGNVIGIDKATNSAGTSSLVNFHPRNNVWSVIDKSNFSLTCVGGWATFDANGSNSYPYNVLSDDYYRNALRMVSTSDFTIDGIECNNAFYHGIIATGKIYGANVLRYRAKSNGYRGIHFHGESVTGNATPEVRDNHFGLLILEGNGRNAFAARNFDENNSGAFIVFDNSLNTTIGTIRAVNEYGYALHLNGGVGAFNPNFTSKYVQVGNLLAEGCGMGLGLHQNIENVHISNYIAWGKKFTLASCDFFATASSLRYFVDANGGISNAKTRLIDIPSGAIAANGLRPNMRVFASGGTTGMPFTGVIVYECLTGTGAGGKDQLRVFDDITPANDPYTTAGTTTLYLRSCKGAGIEFYAASGNFVRDVKFGNISMVNAGTYGIFSILASNEYRYLDVGFGKVSIAGSTITGLNLQSMRGFSFESYTGRDNGSGFDGGLGNGGQENYINLSSDFTISDFRSGLTAGFTSENARLKISVDCRNGVVDARSLKKSTSALLKIDVVSGAPANALGSTGPIVLINPTADDGTPLTVAAGHITRTSATACIVTRPVDAP